MIFNRLISVFGFIFFLFLQQLQAQNPILFEQNDRYGYQLQNGNILCQAQFFIATEFSENGIAYVADSEGWRVINSAGKMLFKPFIYDNAPDKFSEGFARFVADEKIGFYNEKGEISLAAHWTFAQPFKNGKAKVCMDCQKVYQGEHFYYQCKNWFYIDTNGKRIVQHQKN